MTARSASPSSWCSSAADAQAGGLLVLLVARRAVAPDQRDLTKRVARGAAVLVAIPALATAWHSLRRPDLHGIADRLIALAMVAA